LRGIGTKNRGKKKESPEPFTGKRPAIPGKSLPVWHPLRKKKKRKDYQNLQGEKRNHIQSPKSSAEETPTGKGKTLKIGKQGIGRPLKRKGNVLGQEGNKVIFFLWRQWALSRGG